MSSALDTPILSLLPTSRSERAWLSTPEVARLLQAKGHTVNHVKTVNRRLEKFESQGLVLCEQRGKALVWQRKEGASGLAKDAAMTFDEALALQILKQYAGRQLPEQTLGALKSLFDAADARLKALNTDDERRYAKWSRKVASVSGHFQMTPPKIKDEVFQCATAALFTERMLSIHYKSAHNAEKPWRYTIIPLGLVEAGNGLLYLIAQTRSKDGNTYPPVRYRLDRMSSARLLDEKFDYPSDFSLETYVQEERGMEFFSGEKRRVTLKMSADAARYLEEQPLAPDQTLKRHVNASVTITATVVISLRFYEWLLAKSAQIEVVSPKALRVAIIESLADAQRLYQRP